MPKKEELYAQLEQMSKPSYSKGEVKGFIHSVSNDNIQSPSVFKKGDVILNGVGAKKRPCVVVKVLDELLLAIPLSTTKDAMNICESKSRFFLDGWLSCGVWAITKEYAKDNFAGVFDNNKDLNKAIGIMKEMVSKL